MPNNATLNAIRLGSGTLTTAADYQHNIHRDTVTNPFSLILAMRGAEFQAFSRRGRLPPVQMSLLLINLQIMV